MSTLKEIRERFLNNVWPKFGEDGEHLTTGDEIVDFYESEIRTLLEEIEGEINKIDIPLQGILALDLGKNDIITGVSYHGVSVENWAGYSEAINRARAIITRYKE